MRKSDTGFIRKLFLFLFLLNSEDTERSHVFKQCSKKIVKFYVSLTNSVMNKRAFFISFDPIKQCPIKQDKFL